MAFIRTFNQNNSPLKACTRKTEWGSQRRGKCVLLQRAQCQPPRIWWARMVTLTPSAHTQCTAARSGMFQYLGMRMYAIEHTCTARTHTHMHTQSQRHIQTHARRHRYTNDTRTQATNTHRITHVHKHTHTHTHTHTLCCWILPQVHLNVTALLCLMKWIDIDSGLVWRSFPLNYVFILFWKNNVLQGQAEFDPSAIMFKVLFLKLPWLKCDSVDFSPGTEGLVQNIDSLPWPTGKRLAWSREWCGKMSAYRSGVQASI